MSTETYETLHKNNVKDSYQMTNKKKYIPQMLNMVSVSVSLFIIVTPIDIIIDINGYAIFKPNLMISITSIFSFQTKVT